MSLKEACELDATKESGSFSTIDFLKCMGSSTYRKENNIQATNSEVAAGTVPKVELTDGENLIVQLTGDNAYRVQQIAGLVRGDTGESDNLTEEDLNAVLTADSLDGRSLSKDFRRALEYMKDEFHDMTDESNWNFLDTGDLSAQEILDYATNEVDANPTTAMQKHHQRVEQGNTQDNYGTSFSNEETRGNQTIEQANGRKFTRERGNDNVSYEVRKGDCVSRIATDLMQHRLGRKPTASELHDYIDSISLANGLYQNGRNPDLIRIGESLVLPPFGR